jgi:uncharacterized membrane protein
MAMLVFLLGSLLDAFTTTHVFTHPGLVEANPIVNIVLFHSGPFAFFTFLGFKFAIVGVFVAGVLAFAPRTIHRTLLISVAFTCGFLWLGAGIWNSYLLWF